MLTPDQINEGLRLEEGATRGPWSRITGTKDTIEHTPKFNYDHFTVPLLILSEECTDHPIADFSANASCFDQLDQEDNAELIVFLRNHARELLECARRCGEMEKEIERLREFEWKYNDLCK